MAVLTPGVIFLGNRLFSLVLLSVCIVSARLVLNTYTGLSISTSACITLTLLSLPLSLIMRILVDERYHHRRAAALGARMVPRVIGRSFGNFDLIKMIFQEAQDGYPG